MSTGRNDPCPCESGLKFKRCCQGCAIPRLGLQVAAALARHEILGAGVGRDSCVLSTRVLIDVLDKLGVIATPLVVNAIVMNAAYVKCTQEEELKNPRFRMTQEVSDRWLLDYGAYSLGIGFPLGQGPSGLPFVGHLGAVVGGRMFLDLSIDQANRPKMGVEVGAVVWPVEPAFLQGRRGFMVSFGTSAVSYFAFPNDHSFLGHRDWIGSPQKDAERATLVERIVARLKAARAKGEDSRASRELA